MNTFIDFVNRSLAGEGTRGGVGDSEGVGALLLLVLNLAPASSSCFLEMLAGGLTQELCRVVQDLRAIAKDGDLNVIFPNDLADPFSVELLK